MKKNFVLVIAFLLSISLFAGKDITLEDIWAKGTFRQNYVTGIRSMKDGEHYSKLNLMRNKIVKVDYQTGKNETVVFQLSDFPDLFQQDWIMDYQFNSDETKLLISTDYEPIYRHSFKANYYICDLKTNKVLPLRNNDKVQLAEFSPDSENVAYVYENNLYIYYISTDFTEQITKDGEKNKIINGAPDWVYEEEFSFSKAWKWSDNGKYIAYLKTNEEAVKEFNMPIYGNLYPDEYRYKYPKAGEENSEVQALIYSLSDKSTKTIDLGAGETDYIPRILWMPERETLAVVSLNRLQNDFKLYAVDAKTAKAEMIININEEKYHEIHDDMTFIPEKQLFIMSHEKDGYRHLYAYNLDGSLNAQITSGKWEITEFYGYDKKRNVFYYQSAERSPMQRDVYSIALDGSNKKRLNENQGTTAFHFSKTFDYYIEEYSSANTPVKYSLFKAGGNLVRVLEENNTMCETMKEYDWVKKEFTTFKADDGTDLNAWIIKPANFKKCKKYPVLMYVYGGPGSQTVLDDWDGNMPWWQMLVQQGYIVVSVDNRGTGARGKDFRQVTYRELGKFEARDQIAVARQLADLKYIDKERIGIFGWSFGGYMTNLCLTLADVFTAGIAVAPVTNWRYYDSIYTERYNGLPQDNADGYDKNSPINHASKLKGKLLLVHGSADDNVHYQNSMDYINKLVDANKPFELMIYPNKDHSIYGGNARLHLYTKMTNFLLNNL